MERWIVAKTDIRIQYWRYGVIQHVPLFGWLKECLLLISSLGNYLLKFPLKLANNGAWLTQTSTCFYKQEAKQRTQANISDPKCLPAYFTHIIVKKAWRSNYSYYSKWLQNGNAQGIFPKNGWKLSVETYEGKIDK